MPRRELSTHQRNRPPTAPPLIVWAYALLLTVLLAEGLSWLLLRDTPPSEAFFLFNSERLRRLGEKTSAGALGVVLLGDSRTRYALPDDPEFSRRLTDLYGAAVEVVRITANWAIFEDFQPLAGEIFAARPTLILLQEQLRSKERAEPARVLIGRAYLLWLVFGRGPWNPGDLDQYALQHEMRCEALTLEDVEARLERVYRWVSFDPRGPNRRACEQFVTEARARDIAVEYFALPITSSGRNRLPSSPRDDPIRPLVAPFEIPDPSFCDVVHMNRDGREAYSGWLAAEVVRLLAREARP